MHAPSSSPTLPALAAACGGGAVRGWKAGMDGPAPAHHGGRGGGDCVCRHPSPSGRAGGPARCSGHPCRRAARRHAAPPATAGSRQLPGWADPRPRGHGRGLQGAGHQEPQDCEWNGGGEGRSLSMRSGCRERGGLQLPAPPSAAALSVVHWAMPATVHLHLPRQLPPARATRAHASSRHSPTCARRW